MKRNGIKMFLCSSEGIIVLVLEIVLAGSGSFALYAQSLFIENITSYLSNEKIFSLCISFVLLIISFFLPLLSIYSNYLRNKIDNKMNKEWDTNMTELVSRIPYENYEHSEIYNKLKQITDENLIVLEYGFLLSFLSTFISFFAYSIIFLNTSVMLLIAFLFMSPLVGYISSQLAEKEYRKSYALNDDRRLIQYKSSIMRDRDYAKEIRVFDAGDYLLNEWKEKQKMLDIKILRVRLKHGLLSALISKSEYLVAAINLIIILFLYINNSISLGMFVAISGQVFSIRILSNVQSVMASYRKLKEYRSTFSDVASIISKYESEKNCLCNKCLEQKRGFTISLKNVSFKYPNSEEVVLKNINLNFKSNERVAIVGENGVGKTTLIKIILGLYFPTEGEVYINGVNTKNISIEERCNIFSVVFQDFAKFCLTIDENLLLDEENDVINKDIFNLDKIERHLNNGKKTIIGKDYAEGVDLSGGEWQRIAIARAFQKEKKVLIFDEPTAALDPIAEVKLYETINMINKQKNNILIYITHRLGLTRNVNRIIVLEDGSIVEDGTFNELISLKGHYYKLFQSQKALYDWRNINEKKKN